MSKKRRLGAYSFNSTQGRRKNWQNPEDTQKCDFQQWTKGFLQDESANIGDEVTVKLLLTVS